MTTYYVVAVSDTDIKPSDDLFTVRDAIKKFQAEGRVVTVFEGTGYSGPVFLERIKRIYK